MKAEAILASQTLNTNRQPIPLAEFVADIDRRRRETGITELPRNPGKNRTASKRALLKAIEEAGGKW
jgi:hypothetical protein